MENILLSIFERENNRIDNLVLTSESNVSQLKTYEKFAYDVELYVGNMLACSRQVAVKAYFLENNKIQVVFNGFTESKYSKAVITKLYAYKNDEKLVMPFEYEITYTIHNYYSI